nr:NADH dehydrogenase subunit 5 [Histampica sp. CS049]
MLGYLIILFSYPLFLLSFSFFLGEKKFSNFVGSLASVGILGSSFWLLYGQPVWKISILWLNSGLQDYGASLVFDLYTIIFSGVALFVSWSIIEFSYYYMALDPNKSAFMFSLLLFLLFMLILLSANSLFLLFVGWEGVGILSFILIGWWHTRSDASSSALQAIIYNRVGDSGMVFFMAISIICFNSWDLSELLSLPSDLPMLWWGCLGLVIAAMGKSAQFFFHPWLPSAMEGPTPVSALLHSSTMVVAGVFLLIRVFPLLNSSIYISSLGAIGAVTSIFAASVAVVQFDIKKVVAYSTTSQLGLMVVAVGLGMPWLAMFHMCTHAFFKALLFLCSGSIIHSLNNEQDLRKMSGVSCHLPFTFFVLVVSSFALCGIPFLGGFYSKDLILEVSQFSITNSVSVILALISTFLTAIYSFRVVYYLTNYNICSNTIVPIAETNLNIVWPFLRLVGGAIITGWGLSVILFNIQPVIITIIQKSGPILVTGVGLIWALYNLSSFFVVRVLVFRVNQFLANNWFYSYLLHWSGFILLVIGGSLGGVLRTLDQGWTVMLGPGGVSASLSTISAILQSLMTGQISHYLTYIVVLGGLMASFSLIFFS